MHRYLSFEEAKWIVTALRRSTSPAYVMARLSLFYGLRPAEILNLKVLDLDFEHGFILLSGSMCRRRRVPMNKVVKLLLEKISHENPFDYLLKGCRPRQP